MRSFLTAVVVTHHVGCAFGGCGPKSWFLSVNYYWLDADPGLDFFNKGTTSSADYFILALRSFTGINQAYFMPLFFFVSAYLVPDSVRRKGVHSFLQTRAQRIWIPAMFITFLLIPLCFVVGQIGAETYVVPYVIPHPGPGWFLLWLLVFNWCYCQVVASEQRTKE